MNPVFTVSIDTEKRKASAAGLVAVGEKVDVVVTGLDVTQIPEWEQDNDEGFSGPSLRFRLVAPDGKDLVRFPLAEGDAWTIGAEGELTAEVDFNTMPLRHWFHGYEIGAKAEVGIILDSIVDAMEYGRGTVKILQWTASPAEDPTILPDWRKTLRDLNAAIVEIKDSVDLAEGYADDAEASAGVATEKAGVAQTAANNALSSASAAEGFKSDAESAATDARGYKDDAETAADTATTKAGEAASSAGDAAQILEDIEEAIAGKAKQSDLEAEVTRATQKEEELENGLTEANDAISDNADAIGQLEESKADKTAIDALSDAIDSEAETREEKDAAICAKLNQEIGNRQAADNTLSAAIATKADKATTYTKTEVDTKIAGVQTFQKYLVQTLPAPEAADMKGLYLVPTGETTEEGDLCEEWTVIEEDGKKRWEKIGAKAVNLTLDDAVTRTSGNGVKSSGIWSAIWGALASLPTGFSSLYDWVVAQLAGKATKADATLTERGFSAWVCNPSTILFNGTTYPAVVYRFAPGPGFVYWAVSQRVGGTPYATQPYDEAATSLTFSLEDGFEPRTVIATRTALPGYQLGSQTTKPVASEAEAEALRQGKQDALSAQQLANIAAVTGIADLLVRHIVDVQGVDIAVFVGYRIPWGISGYIEINEAGIHFYHPPVHGGAGADYTTAFPFAAGTLALAAPNPTAGNLAALDANGNPTDAGWTAGELARYSLVAKTIDNGAVTLDDRAINAVAVSSSLASLTINFPTATSGKARDFGLRLTVASGVTTAPELALPQGVVCENADGEAPEIGADGAATILYFTEMASGVFLVKGEVVTAIS